MTGLHYFGCEFGVRTCEATSRTSALVQDTNQVDNRVDPLERVAQKCRIVHVAFHKPHRRHDSKTAMTTIATCWNYDFIAWVNKLRGDLAADETAAAQYADLSVNHLFNVRDVKSADNIL